MNILLGLTGSVAATLAPKLVKSLSELGTLWVVSTEKSLYFFDYFELEKISSRIIADSDEWSSNKYHRDQDIPHISLGDWADLLVIAPLTANTLSKMANGYCDNLLTSIYYAWDKTKPVIIAPSMGVNMWNNRLTQKNLETLVELGKQNSCGYSNSYVVPPQAKRLACGKTGVGAMADISSIVNTVKLIGNARGF